MQFTFLPNIGLFKHFIKKYLYSLIQSSHITTFSSWGTHTDNTYQSLLSFPINFLVSSSSIIVGGASDDGPYCADAIKRSVDGFNVSTCIIKKKKKKTMIIISYW